MRKSKYNSFDELPLMLTVEDVSHVLGIGLAHAYEVAHRRDFPTITLGSRIIVNNFLNTFFNCSFSNYFTYICCGFNVISLFKSFLSFRFIC